MQSVKRLFLLSLFLLPIAAHATVCPSTVVGPKIREVCTANVTWSAVTDGSAITVEAIGAGGGGCGGNAGGGGNNVAGGGGGEYAKSTTISYTSLASITVTIGSPGTGGASSGNG